MGLTVQELHYDFNLMADKIGGNDRRSFSLPEVDWLLNRAQSAILNQQVDVFELNSKRTHDLMSIHIKQPLQGPITAILHSDRILSPNGNIYVYEVIINNTNFVATYFSFTKIAAVLVKNTCDYRASARYMDNDDFETGINSSLDLSENSFFVNMGQSSTGTTQSLYLYTLYPIKENKVYIEYIKQPRKINIGGYTYLDNTTTVLSQCELPERLQHKLVNYAVAIAFNAMNDEAYSLKKDMISTLTE